MKSYHTPDVTTVSPPPRGGHFRCSEFGLLLAILLLFSGTCTRADSRWVSPDERYAREAFQELRSSTFLVTECERAFLTFWRVFIAEGDRGMVRNPYGNVDQVYFGYGNLESAPLLPEAQDTCARQTGARGDLVVQLLKEREHIKLKRIKKFQHAERIIGY